ncbi:MAG: hypothetical protein KDK70_11980 [Myxococcales bacterium]|nr:hypothetical protein [Myxococcales bacterium]
MAHPWSSSTTTLLGLAATLTLGCPGDDSSAEAGSSNADDSTTSEPSTGGSTSGTMSGSASSVGTAEESGSESGSTGPGGPPCGEVTCSAAEYCDWSLDACGSEPSEPSDQGTCMPRPEGCDAVYQPVCGCDGQVHGNECEAQSAGVDVDAQGECEAPKGYFGCGHRFCSVGAEYCQVSVSDVGGIPDGYSCRSPAEPCEPLACECLSNEPCFEFSCEEASDGGVEIVCPGG